MTLMLPLIVAPLPIQIALSVIWIILVSVAWWQVYRRLDARNEAVCQYRRTILDQIRIAAETDVELNRDWRWRYDAFDAVSYSTMFWQGWKPLDAFYPDRRFCEP